MFHRFSGLKLNAAKSELYAAGMNPNRQSTEFQIRSLPVRYLGVPLTSRKLTSEKVKERIAGLLCGKHLITLFRKLII